MLKKTILVCALVSPMLSFASDDSYRQEIQQRIAPVGHVAVEQSAHQTAAPKPKKVVPPGEQVFKTYCTTCHSMGIAGAPKFRHAQDWAPRTKKGLKQLVASAIKGIAPNMPAKGTCAECSDAQIQAAIEYMLPKAS